MALARRRLAFSSGLGGLGKSFRRGKKSKKKLDVLDEEPARGKRRGTWCCGRRAKVYADGNGDEAAAKVDAGAEADAGGQADADEEAEVGAGGGGEEPVAPAGDRPLEVQPGK